MSEFPEHVCPYAAALASHSPRFARQCYEVPSSLLPPPSSLSTDPFGELTTASKCYGLKQRFPDRVLVMTSKRCFMNCRHCTRRWLLDSAEVVENPAALRRCVAYVKQHPKVRDVLLSGGDILTLPDGKVREFVDAFAALRQVEIVRVCTRALAVNPGRVTVRLASALAASRKVWVNTQFNCADEVTPAAVRAAALLIDRGIPVSCQTVLLKGVNDSGAEMLRLLRALSAARIRPYYVFMCDPVVGTERFWVSKEKARRIENYCAERIGGLCLPRFVSDIPGARRKVPI